MIPRPTFACTCDSPCVCALSALQAGDKRVARMCASSCLHCKCVGSPGKKLAEAHGLETSTPPS